MTKQKVFLIEDEVLQRLTASVEDNSKHHLTLNIRISRIPHLYFFITSVSPPILTKPNLGNIHKYEGE